MSKNPISSKTESFDTNEFVAGFAAGVCWTLIIVVLYCHLAK